MAGMYSFSRYFIYLCIAYYQKNEGLDIQMSYITMANCLT